MHDLPAALTPTAIDLPEALKSFHEFYSTAFYHLLVALGIAVAVVGVFPPLLMAFLQSRSQRALKEQFDASRKELEASRTAMEGKIADVQRSIQEEADRRLADLLSHFETESAKSAAETTKAINYLRGAVNSGRGEMWLMTGRPLDAIGSFLAACKYWIGNDLNNQLPRAVSSLGQALRACPKVNESFMAVFNGRVDEVIKALRDAPDVDGLLLAQLDEMVATFRMAQHEMPPTQPQP